MTQEALKLALEALAVRFSEGWHEGIKIDASDIMLLNMAAQALAQPEQEFVCSTGLCHYKAEQEPVAWAWKNTKTDGRGIYWENPDQFFDLAKPSDYEWIPLYATPPQRTWVGLPHQERNAIRGKYWIAMSDDVFDDIEAKLKQKNGYAEEKNT